MTLPVVWTPDACLNLQEIIHYIANENPAAARSLKSMTEAAPQIAVLTPHLFRAERVLGTRDIVVHPNYIVVYKATDRIEVVSVIHSRQRYPFG